MAPTIASLLKTHPISLLDNLVEIANALAIPLEKKPKKAKLQSDIEECLITYPAYEQTVRNMANEYVTQHKQSLAQTQNPELQEEQSNVSISQETQSQDLFVVSQIMETDQLQEDSPLPKRKLTEDDESTNNVPKIRLLHSDIAVTKLTNLIDVLAKKIESLEQKISFSGAFFFASSFFLVWF